jgi:WD40 repeat protein
MLNRKVLVFSVVFCAGLGAAQQGLAPVWRHQAFGRWVNHAAFNSNATLMVSAGGDQVARVWNVTTGQEVLKLVGHTSWVGSAFFSKDGSKIITSSGDDTARVWNAKTGQELLAVEQDDDVNFAVFSPDNNSFLTSGDDKTATLWDTKTGKRLRTFKGHTDGVYFAVFSRDAQRIVTTSVDKTVRVWEVKTGKSLLTIKHTGTVYGAAFFQNNTRLVTGSDSTIRIWDTKNGKLVSSLKGHTDDVNAVEVAPNGQQLASASDDSSVRIWDLRTGKTIKTFSGHEDLVYSAAYSADGHKLVTAGTDGSVRVWNIKSGQAERTVIGHVFDFFNAAFSNDNQTVIGITSSNQIRLLNTKTGELKRSISTASTVYDAQFSSDDKEVITAERGDRFVIWDSQTGRQLVTIEGHGHQFSTAVFTKDKSKVLSVGRDGSASLWDVKTGTEVGYFETDDAIRSAVFTPDQTKIITLDDANLISVWDASGKSLFQTVIQANDDTDRRFDLASPDASVLLIHNDLEAAFLWDLKNKSVVRKLDNSAGLRLNISADYSRIAGVDPTEHLVRLWDASTGKVLGQIALESTALENTARAVVFSPDGKSIAVGTKQFVQTYDLPAEMTAQPAPTTVVPSLPDLQATNPNTEKYLTRLRELNNTGLFTGAQFLGIKRSIEENRIPKEILEFFEGKLSQKDLIELVQSGFFERFGIPAGKP